MSLSQPTFICKMKANRPSFPSITTVTDVGEDKTNEQNIYRKAWKMAPRRMTNL